MAKTDWNKCYALIIGTDNIDSIIHEAVFAYYDPTGDGKIVVKNNGTKTWNIDQNGSSINISTGVGSKCIILYYGFTEIDAY